MAYALALKSTFDFEKGPIMLIVTLIYCFISILGVGSFMGTLLERLNVSNSVTSDARASGALEGFEDGVIKSVNEGHI